MGKARGVSPQRRAAILAAAERRFGPGNRYGVVAFGLGHPRCRGVDRSGSTLVVHVERKEKHPPAPIRALRVRIGSRTERIMPDVVGVGVRPRARFRSGDIEFGGLHPGAAIVVPSTRQAGSVGLLLGEDGEPTHLLTAGHLFEPDDEGARIIAAREGKEPKSIGQLEVNLLDDDGAASAGLPAVVDVALVRLNERGVDLATSTDAPLSLTSTASLRLDETRPTRLYSWRRGDFSQAFVAARNSRVVHMDGERSRPNFTVRDVYTSEDPLSIEGDSGTAVFAQEADQWVALGLCVGQHGGEMVIEPVERALAGLRRVSGDLTIWSGDA